MVVTLETNTGTVYGETYYIVHPVIQPVWRSDPAEWNSMLEWMIETFGPAPNDGVWTPGARWYANSARFWFREPADRDWFLLRWS